MSRRSAFLIVVLAAGCGGGGLVEDPEQASIVALYQEDPIRYWARFGLPALSRATLLDEQHGYFGDAFDVLTGEFLAEPFAAAVATGDGLTTTAHDATLAVPTGPHLSLLVDAGSIAAGTAVDLAVVELAVVAPPDAGCAVDHLHQADAGGIYIGAEGPFQDPDPDGCGFGPVYQTVDPWRHFQLTLRLLTQALDAAVDAADDASIEAATADLASIYGAAFDATAIDEMLAPQAQLYDPAVDPPDDTPVCAPPTPVGGTPPAEMPWADVRDSSAWGTAKNAMCVALAVGACAARLGLHDDTVTCEEWGTLSDKLNAVPTGGASMFDADRWLRERASARREPLCRPRFTYRSPPVPMCAQARTMLNLGCDVMVHYQPQPPTGVKHVELVTGVDVLFEPDPAKPDTDCVFHTLSWGRSASVDIQRDNSFRNKSDASAYDGKLDGGEAVLYSFCRCKDVPEGD